MSRLGWNSSQLRSSRGLYPSLWATAAATAAAELNSMSSWVERFAEVRARVLLSRGARVVRDRAVGLRAVARGLGGDGPAGVSSSSASTNLPPPPGPPGTYFLFLSGGSSSSCDWRPRDRTGTRPERELRGVVGLEDMESAVDRTKVLRMGMDWPQGRGWAAQGWAARRHGEARDTRQGVWVGVGIGRTRSRGLRCQRLKMSEESRAKMEFRCPVISW